ncbi:MAG: hypothetical protein KDA41_09145, partial [Planctomycetales bacterium]|nr:hypothetical protein [Planctomycetales bacterium]
MNRRLFPDLPEEEEPAPSADVGPTPAPATAKAPAVEASAASLADSSTESLADKVVYVVDSHSLIYQVFHVIAEMTSPSGQPVNAVYGFARDLLMILEQKKPDYLFCAFDSSGPTFRHELYVDYKVDREEMPQELRPQIPAAKRLCAALGIPVLESPRHEADDILATLARQVDAAGGQCVLVTGDKDCRQLITDRVRLYNIRKDEFFDAASLEATWGIRPDQVVDFQALIGDPTDHIPGVPLIGPKSAAALLVEYDTLENLLDRASEIKGKKGQNLQEYREQALLSQQLTRLDVDSPVEVRWPQGRVGCGDRDAALALFHAFGNRSFADGL